jgi:HEAT repeat protein
MLFGLSLVKLGHPSAAFDAKNHGRKERLFTTIVDPLASTEELIDLANNESLEISDRTRAVEVLSERKDPRVLGTLIKLLLGHYDLLTHAVIVALGELEDPRALPALRGVLEKARKEQM